MEQPRGIQWTLMQELEDPDFANDVSLLSHTMGHMQAKTKRLAYCQDSRSRDNITKTKSMQINASQEAPLTADGRALRKLIASLTWAAL